MSLRNIIKNLESKKIPLKRVYEYFETRDIKMALLVGSYQTDEKPKIGDLIKKLKEYQNNYTSISTKVKIHEYKLKLENLSTTSNGKIGLPMRGVINYIFPIIYWKPGREFDCWKTV